MCSAGDRLRSGMSVRDVCDILQGWTFRRAGTPDTPPRFHTWDFTSPDEAETLRVTFDGIDLCLWGAPAQPGILREAREWHG